MQIQNSPFTQILLRKHLLYTSKQPIPTPIHSSQQIKLPFTVLHVHSFSEPKKLPHFSHHKLILSKEESFCWLNISQEASHFPMISFCQQQQAYRRVMCVLFIWYSNSIHITLSYCYSFIYQYTSKQFSQFICELNRIDNQRKQNPMKQSH